ncbi:hypothetical protein [Winogradskyella flava]|uniref:Uncharacterized protein n=1 Tax=Winogradskyella flava TaxID=1884876 RepID=A0A842ILC2_9FLAO|nr:hypothetical protein [Winogradskyella flava]MBC2843501.1 hypothetical protein [Winogradskyella flava]
MKNISDLGKVLNTIQQKRVTGGYNRRCPTGLCGFYGGSCRPCGEDRPPQQ